MDKFDGSFLRPFLTYEKLLALAALDPAALTDEERERVKRAVAIPEEQRNLLRHISDTMDEIVMSAEKVHDLICDYLEGEDMQNWKGGGYF